jgi:hypothetical protein
MGLLGPRTTVVVALPVVCAEAPAAAVNAKTRAHNAFLMFNVMT